MESSAQSAGQRSSLIAYDGFVPVVDLILIVFSGGCLDPRPQVSRVFVQRVIEALLYRAPHHGVGLGVQPRGQRFENSGARLVIVDLPVVPLPKPPRRVQADGWNRIIEVAPQGQAQSRIVGQILEMLIEKLGRAPARRALEEREPRPVPRALVAASGRRSRIMRNAHPAVRCTILFGSPSAVDSVHCSPGSAMCPSARAAASRASG